MTEKNILFRLGLGFTDEDLIETWSLDPKLDIDQQMYDITENKTFQANMQNGMDEGSARRDAKKQRATTIRNQQKQLVDKAMRDQRKKK